VEVEEQVRLWPEDCESVPEGLALCEGDSEWVPVRLKVVVATCVMLWDWEPVIEKVQLTVAERVGTNVGVRGSDGVAVAEGVPDTDNRGLLLPLWVVV